MMHMSLQPLKKLNNIKTDIYHNLPLVTMKSGVMEMYHNDPDTYTDDPEDFWHYCSWLLHGHRGNNIQTSISNTNNDQLDLISNSQVFTNIKIFTYIHPVCMYVLVSVPG